MWPFGHQFLREGISVLQHIRLPMDRLRVQLLLISSLRLLLRILLHLQILLHLPRYWA